MENATPPMYEETTLQAPYKEGQISPCLIKFLDTQTLKLIGYIKHRKVILVIDNDHIHSFIY